jgi:hypothetical protein
MLVLASRGGAVERRRAGTGYCSEGARIRVARSDFRMGPRQKPMRQRAYAALSVTQRLSSGIVSPLRHWKSLSDRASPHLSNAADCAGQSSAPSSHSRRHSARVPPGQRSGRAHRPSQPVAPLAPLPPAPPAPPAPAEPPVPAEPPAPLLPTIPRPAAPPPPAPAAPLPAAPPALLPPLPALLPPLPPVLPSPPSSSEQAGGRLMRSKGRSHALRIGVG